MKRGSVASFWARVDRSRGCWVWLGSGTPKGYGQFTPAGGRRQYVHRYAYELLVGPIPEGLTLDHLCGVRACVNPAHLEPTERGVNALRGDGPAAVNARRRHCPCGRDYDRNYDGHRRCSECDKRRSRLWRLKEAS